TSPGATNPGVKAIAMAEGQGVSVALPVSGLGAGQTHFEGTLTHVATRTDGSLAISMKARDGEEWDLSLASGAALTYSEGDAASPGVVRPGMAVAVDGVASGN